MDLYFIRHAETTYNVEKKYYGKTNPPLTEKGILQLKELATELGSIKVNRIYTSALDRTRQTAQIICQSNQWPVDLIQPCDQLNEMDFGEWEGLTADEVAVADPKAWAAFMNAPLSIYPTKGEHFNTFKKRVIKAFEEIIEDHESTSTLLFVGHLGALRIIIHEYFEPHRNFFDIEFSKQAIKHYTIGE